MLTRVGSKKKMQTETEKTPARAKFQFSNPTAQSAEARLNAEEARKLLQRWIPEHLKETPEDPPTSAAGTCFRNVSAILAGKGTK